MPLFRFRSLFSLLPVCALVLAMFVVAGCTGGKVRTDAPVAEKEIAPQDSLRAKFKLTIVQNGENQELDAVLFSVPGKRYRMELTGPMGIGVASMLWTEEGWLMTFPTEKLYVKGVGYMVGLLNDRSLPLVHIHQIAAFFEGKLLPDNYEDVVPGHEAVDGTGRHFTYELQDSRVVQLTYTGRDGKPETLKFFGFREFEGNVLPETIVFERGEKRFLEIKIKKVTHGKSFSGGTWKLNVPRSFKLVEQ
ncbi:hypothetical protein [Fibrobacter sp. HC4]|uniref:hypothetical protein n=1 Tax=Fibrobacter sp. HC4 TaxID=3239812 RepID=UPI002018B993|nr:hypothetical protein [Fibrobacter succinogenes]MCL4102245.1 hypothetical protein [Fibrobacter succinogenes]